MGKFIWTLSQEIVTHACTTVNVKFSHPRRNYDRFWPVHIVLYITFTEFIDDQLHDLVLLLVLVLTALESDNL